MENGKDDFTAKQIEEQEKDFTLGRMVLDDGLRERNIRLEEGNMLLPPRLSHKS